MTILNFYRMHFAIALAMLAQTASPIWAAEAIWTGEFNENWQLPLNWEDSLMPAPGDDATFDQTAARKDVILIASVIVNKLTLDSSAPYTFSSGLLSSLNFADLLVPSTGAPVRHTLNVPVTPLADDGWAIGQFAAVEIQQSLAGDVDVTKLGDGTLVLTGDNSNYDGDITVDAGVLEVGVGNSLGNNTDVAIASGGVLRIADNEGFGGLNGSGSIELLGDIGVGTGDQTSAFFGTISGNGGFDKKGTGVQTLSGANTYTQRTEVQSGTLLLNNTSGSSTGTAYVEVQHGAKLGGNGSSSGTTNVLSGGTVAPGDDIGSLTLGDVMFEPGATLAIQIAGLTSESEHDVLSINNTANLGGTLKLEFDEGFTADPADSFVVLTANSISGAFTNVTSTDGRSWAARYDTTNHHVIVERDCDQNGIANTEDIANCNENPLCMDCNGNGIPDGCYEDTLPRRNATFPFKHTLDGDFDGAEAVYAADLDGDGDLDILGAAQDADDIAWWENVAGDGSAWTKNIVADNFNWAKFVYAADIDNDGDHDILGAALLAGDIAWWENVAGDGSAWTRHTVINDFNGATSVYADDVDGDGDTDILGTAGSDNDITWWENTSVDGSAWTEHRIDGTFRNAQVVVTADMDGDGDVDVLGAARDANDITWFDNVAGDGSTWTENTVAGNFTGAEFVFAADVDGDGDNDILGAAWGANDIAWWENTTGNGANWTKHTIDATFAGAVSVFATDVDGDGDIDVLGAAANADDITWWENTIGDGSEWFEHTLEGDFDGAEFVFAADVDGDGDTDILGAAKDADDIAWWENRGGQYKLTTTATAPENWTAGQSDDLFEIVVIHNGRSGDNSIELESVALLFEESAGVPLTTQAAEGVIDGVSIYLDDGSGSFDAGTDALVTSLESLNLVEGVQSIGFTPGDPLAQVAFDVPNAYFVTATLRSQVSSSSPKMFHITHVATTSSVVDVVSGCPILQEYSGSDVTAIIQNIISDCNTNGVDDLEDISLGTSADCNSNEIPDDCELDGDTDGVPDDCDACPGFDDTVDTDSDGIPNGCDTCAGGASSADADGNGVVDLEDYAEFKTCLDGPSGTVGIGCECFDFDDDGDNDLSDFAQFQLAMDGN